MKGWINVFRTGTWTDSAGNEATWTEEDLDKIVSQYDPKTHEAPLVLGHPKDDEPAYGWVEAIKRVGKDLWVKPRQMAKDLYNAVLAGQYKKISIALNSDGSLRHVGFLGAATPAVKGLKPIELSDDDKNLPVIEFELKKPGENQTILFQENQMDELEKLKQDLAAAEARNAELEKNFQDSEAKNKKNEEDLAAERRAARVAKYQADVREWRGWGQLTEDQGNAAVALMEMLHDSEFKSLPESKEFTSFRTGEKSPVDVFKELVNALPKKAEFTEIATKENAADGKQNEDRTAGEFNDGGAANVDEEGLRIRNLAKARAEEKKISFREAYREIMNEEGVNE